MGFDGAVKKDGENLILNYLKNSGADILCLQEYQTIESPRYLSQKDVEKALKDYPYHNIQIVGRGSGKGHTNRIACYSKFPILSSRTLDYASEYNGSVVYELKMGEDTVMLINNHLESNKLTKEDKVVYESMLKSPETEKVKSGFDQTGGRRNRDYRLSFHNRKGSIHRCRFHPFQCNTVRIDDRSGNRFTVIHDSVIFDKYPTSAPRMIYSLH